MRMISDTQKVCGETHHKSKLSDLDIERIRQLYEHGVSYGILARCFGVSKEAIGRYCRYERRNVIVERVKE